MTDPQFMQLLASFGSIGRALAEPKTFTITGAADFPILAGTLTLVTGLVVYVWQDLRSEIRGKRGEDKEKCLECRQRQTREADAVWTALRDCQTDCCPRGKGIQ